MSQAIAPPNNRFVSALTALSEFTPSLILLDLRMPVMDGWEFARRYEAMPGPRAPIVATSDNEAGWLTGQHSPW